MTDDIILRGYEDDYYGVSNIRVSMPLRDNNREYILRRYWMLQRSIEEQIAVKTAELTKMIKENQKVMREANFKL